MVFTRTPVFLEYCKDLLLQKKAFTMIDIKIIRENPDIVENNLNRRHKPLQPLHQLIELDLRRREIIKEVEELKKERNNITKNIALLKEQNKPVTSEMQKVKELPDRIKELDKELAEKDERCRNLLLVLPNILQESVHSGKDESENNEIYSWGEKTKFDFTPKDHQDLGLDLKMLDIERATKLAGARFYFLKGDLALLEMSIMRFAADFLMRKKYMLTMPPHMMRKEAYEGVVSLNDFEDVLYKIDNEDLPVKLAGFSSCYRKEAGTHGKDTKGIFRVHQFSKVEQVVLCKPDQSQKLHEEMLENVKEIHKALEIPHRVIVLCSGDTGTVSSKTYDLEAWMPVQGKYRELASCSNCTDYQSRRLQIKYGQKDQPASGLVHTLNSTAAVDRALVAIMENFQKEDGSIKIPKALQPYMGKKEITMEK